MLKHNGKTLHRAETQRRREKPTQDFIALSCEKPLKAYCDKALLVLSGDLSGEAGNWNIYWFSLRLCVSAREYCF
jgi:hypothetical protein